MFRYFKFIMCFAHFYIFAESYNVFYLQGTAKAFLDGKKDAQGKVQTQSLKLKDQLETPFTIKTGNNSVLIIRSKTKINKIAANTIIEFKENKNKSEFNISSGGFVTRFTKPKNMQVNNDIVINSRSASLGVRGTTFMYHVDKKSQKNFLSVKEGVVAYQGINSQDEIEVAKGLSAISNKNNQNLEPRSYEFQEHINWDLEDTSKDLSQPQKLYSSFEKVWNKYKEEMEFTWKNRNKEMEDKWKTWKKSN